MKRGQFRLIVGTGRCGSTLLSRMLDQHPEVVCLHEFFTGLDWGQRFQNGDVSSKDLIAFLSAEQVVTTEVLSRGYVTDEICYPFNTPQAQRQKGDKLPWLLVSMLSRLSNNPDPLFDDFVGYLETIPAQPLSRSYPQIFDWLAQKAGGSIWIERSGSSVDYLDALVQMFPGAKILHIHRDGREAALSIRAHPFYRLGVALLMNLLPEGLGERETIDYVLETPPPLDAVGTYWSDQVVKGKRAAQSLDDRHYKEVSFESLVTAPTEVLAEVAVFFDLPISDTFIRDGSALSKGIPTRRFNGLQPAEQDILAQACLPGRRLLKQTG